MRLPFLVAIFFVCAFAKAQPPGYEWAKNIGGNQSEWGKSLVVSSTLLQALPDKLRAAQETFARTGGLHASAIFDCDGKLVVLREDVGRHNALDKALGYALRAGLLPLENHLLMVSGRVSFELMQKALAAGIPVVVAISAPSSLAVEFAQGSGQTLVGFLRGATMNVYAHGWRVEAVE